MVRLAAKAIGRKPSEIILDQNQHQQACKQLEEGPRRGRPDILQYVLLTILESPAAQAGLVEVAVHTRNNELIRIRPGTRLPRGESRFQGLMSKVLREGRSQDKEPLVWIDEVCTPAEALTKFAKGRVIRLDESGESAEPIALTGQPTTVVLGGFPDGGFSDAWKAAAPATISLWPTPLVAWAIAAEVVAAWRPAPTKSAQI